MTSWTRRLPSLLVTPSFRLGEGVIFIILGTILGKIRLIVNAPVNCKKEGGNTPEESFTARIAQKEN